MNIKVWLFLLLINAEVFSMNKTEIWFPNNPQEEIYPMPLFCTLTVENVDKAADWYVKILGFRVIFAVQDAASKERFFVHLRREKYQDILLKQGKTDRETNQYGVAISLQAWGDLDALTKHAQSAGAIVVQEPNETLMRDEQQMPWNVSSVTFQDLDGYRITFVHPGKELLQKITEVDPGLLASREWE